ncbi:orotate phosphoribosyltransferase [Ligilactobacillus acidipiscis DSM 15836]|uniref:Orotate phosphoribosyltransferase n=2 Tax=Ligilactobacillus acidipiscis TaxID=89059 RepID=A0A0R2K2C5_9LACO|nr:orotate phosphoribosyltransferase [Ligilactobacillus acidipiscis]KRM31496.1 orotate phosphoribosyltransferase [Ligilactobacillus acidipiscis DSM 15836]KRN83785.1 orotate phosphoribosyltransferase [Ligilactobacillus acidipiscis]WEV55874.1 orotate phosphoribosyltransferase [Ligilactobacillus acidipiscis]SFV40667.1 Orotate phosphoribosyltransferase [Ligilactobacillus acidipiscis]GAW63166.1 orotate phosphoribosyltransferase [Ligilactobacillus acidipiscis]
MRKIAEALLDIEAVKLSPAAPFTWASGIKSPIYCDNRLTISYPAIRKEIANGIADLIRQNYPSAEVIAGTATAGIPHAAWVADILELPLIYVRSKPKDHGKGKQTEGVLRENQKVVLIDDLLSTGGSVLKAATALENENAVVLGVVGIFSYELRDLQENFAKRNLTFHTLTNFSELIEAAQQKSSFTQAEVDSMFEWKKSPKNWK